MGDNEMSLIHIIHTYRQTDRQTDRELLTFEVVSKSESSLISNSHCKIKKKKKGWRLMRAGYRTCIRCMMKKKSKINIQS